MLKGKPNRRTQECPHDVEPYLLCPWCDMSDEDSFEGLKDRIIGATAKAQDDHVRMYHEIAVEMILEEIDRSGFEIVRKSSAQTP